MCVTRRRLGFNVVGSFPARRDKGKYFNCSLQACFLIFFSFSFFSLPLYPLQETDQEKLITRHGPKVK